MIRVLVVEDDAAVRGAVAATVEAAAGLSLVAACATGAAAITAASRSPFDVALVDLGLPDRSGAEVITALRRARPDGVVVAYTIFDDAATVMAALRAGARGYLLKRLRPSELVDAIREAAAGGAPMTATIARLALDELLGDAQPPAVALTQREREVLELLARGLSYGDAATALGIGLGTVQSHVKSIYRKLDVDSKAAAATAAARLGIV